MVVDGEVPANLYFIPGLSDLVSPQDIDKDHFSAVLMVDCGEPQRCGTWLEPMLSGKRLFCLDHHSTNEFVGEVAVIEPQAVAAGEIVCAICQEAGLNFDDDSALSLYTAIAGDTGCFRYLNTTPRCLNQCATLLPQVDFELIRIQLFATSQVQKYSSRHY